MTHEIIKQFYAEREQAIEQMSADPEIKRTTQSWFNATYRHDYSYNFSWMGRPIIQYPQDMLAMQEIIWNVKPDLIIETGVAHGGSLIYYASLLHLLNNGGKVLGIDIDIRDHNRAEIEAHPMFAHIELFQGSSVGNEAVSKTAELAQSANTVLVVLDSNHTHAHVLNELQLYSPFVTQGSYLVVYDTVVEDLPANSFPERPWDIGDNPKTAVHEFLAGNQRFEIDQFIQNKLLVTVAPDGYLKCVSD